MDHISSSEFRLRYSKLTEPAEVEVLGRVIGTWYPAATVRYEHTVAGVQPTTTAATVREAPEPVSAKQAQAERDAVLRRMNTKGGRA